MPRCFTGTDRVPQRRSAQPLGARADTGNHGSQDSAISFLFLVRRNSMDFLSAPGGCSDRWVVGDTGAAIDARTLNIPQGRAPF
jgi:hypothetical protein